MLDSGNLGADSITFSGTEEVSLDDKNRLLISKRKRERLGEDFVLALSEIGVVAAYPKSTWKAMCAELWKVPTINLGRQQYGRLVMGSAVEEVNCDAQGRLVIPAKLKADGKLVDKVFVVGNIEKVEFWAEAEWKEYNKSPDTYGIDRLKAIEKAINLMAGVRNG
jgi:MraZ protein